MVVVLFLVPPCCIPYQMRVDLYDNQSCFVLCSEQGTGSDRFIIIYLLLNVRIVIFSCFFVYGVFVRFSGVCTTHSQDVQNPEDTLFLYGCANLEAIYIFYIEVFKYKVRYFWMTQVKNIDLLNWRATIEMWVQLSLLFCSTNLLLNHIMEGDKYFRNSLSTVKPPLVFEGGKPWEFELTNATRIFPRI